MVLERSECQAWIYAILTERFEQDEYNARDKATRFDACGANLYEEARIV